MSHGACSDEHRDLCRSLVLSPSTWGRHVSCGARWQAWMAWDVAPCRCNGSSLPWPRLASGDESCLGQRELCTAEVFVSFSECINPALPYRASRASDMVCCAPSSASPFCSLAHPVTLASANCAVANSGPFHHSLIVRQQRKACRGQNAAHFQLCKHFLRPAATGQRPCSFLRVWLPSLNRLARRGLHERHCCLSMHTLL